ncbi:MAG: NAD(P)/FAD-dependent oxidoreductase [Sandaracinaceae bacterium]|nr:NAD(P)/FAD-dependent oxidoreductase [Sandaracinaceae bacterium]
MLRREEQHVVVLGGGFAGLAAARILGTRGRRRVRVTIVDRHNHHLFQPLLYQVATAALAAPDIAAPIRKLVRSYANTTVLLAEVTRIDRVAHKVLLDDGHGSPTELTYDHLVVATGMQSSYFGHPEWEAHAPGLKTLGEALEIRNRILRAFEAAENEPDVARRRELTTFVVVGAGPTGVELAGAIAEIAGRTLARDFRRFDPTTARVILLEGGDRVLPSFTPDLSEQALASMKRLGVEVRLGARVTGVEADVVRVGAEEIRTRTVLWAAGLSASPLTKDLGVETDRAGRVKIERDLTIPGDSHVYVVGDLLSLDQDGKPLPGVAQVAMQSGRLAAENILRTIDGEPRASFRYVDKGSMATIGRAKAVADVNGRRFAGFFAWLLWLFIHVLFLVDFRNRLAVLFEWAWAYLTWQRSSRVILEAPEGRSPPRDGRER